MRERRRSQALTQEEARQVLADSSYELVGPWPGPAWELEVRCGLCEAVVWALPERVRDAANRRGGAPRVKCAHRSNRIITPSAENRARAAKADHEGQP